MPFKLTKKYDFLPLLNFPKYEPLEVIYETKLLGITLTSDLSWWPHVNDISRRATGKLWVIVRFKSLGGSEEQIPNSCPIYLRICSPSISLRPIQRAEPDHWKGAEESPGYYPWEQELWVSPDQEILGLKTFGPKEKLGKKNSGQKKYFWEKCWVWIKL